MEINQLDGEEQWDGGVTTNNTVNEYKTMYMLINIYRCVLATGQHEFIHVLLAGGEPLIN